MLKALAQGASFVRKKLGESVGTLQKFNTPSSRLRRLRWRRFTPTRWDAPP